MSPLWWPVLIGAALLATAPADPAHEHVCTKTGEHRTHECNCGHSWYPIEEER